VKCSAEKYKANKDSIDAKNNLWVKRNRKKSNEIKKRWGKANTVHVKKLAKDWFKANRTRVVAKQAEWRRDPNNRDIQRENVRRKRRNNPGLYLFLQNKRRASKLNATPVWADTDAIKRIYHDCPKGMTVDHIVPLQGKFVCGLNIPENLQYLSPSENSIKGNSFDVIFTSSDGLPVA